MKGKKSIFFAAVLVAFLLVQQVYAEVDLKAEAVAFAGGMGIQASTNADIMLPSMPEMEVYRSLTVSPVFKNTELEGEVYGPQESYIQI